MRPVASSARNFANFNTAPATAVAPAPALRVLPSVAEPPPWLDAPFEDEVAESPRAIAPREPSRSASSSPAAPAPALVVTALGTRWDEWVRGLNEAGAISAFARELAMQAQCVALDDEATPVVCRLRVEREVLRGAAPREKLEAALSQYLQRGLRLELEPGVAEDSPARREGAERARRQAAAERIIHDDPLVQALMAQYKTARIVPGSVKPH